MHPEGTVTRDPDGWPMIGKSGAARLALLAPEVPVIPIAQWGVQNSIDLYRRKVRLIPRPRHELAVGTPIDLDRVPGRAARREDPARGDRTDHATAPRGRGAAARPACPDGRPVLLGAAVEEDAPTHRLGPVIS